MQYFEQDDYNRPTIIDEILAERERNKPKVKTYTQDEVKAMLTELKTEIEKQCKIPNNNASAYDWNNGVYACYKAVQQKIESLKGDKE